MENKDLINRKIARGLAPLDRGQGVDCETARERLQQRKADCRIGVLLAERWIIAALRYRKFFSIEDLNQAIRELRDRINQRPFRKREGSCAGDGQVGREFERPGPSCSMMR